MIVILIDSVVTQDWAVIIILLTPYPNTPLHLRTTLNALSSFIWQSVSVELSLVYYTVMWLVLLFQRHIKIVVFAYSSQIHNNQLWSSIEWATIYVYAVCMHSLCSADSIKPHTA